MSPTIQERIQTDMVAAMKGKDAATLSTLRMLKSALMEAKSAKSRDAVLSADEEIEILQRYIKKRRETIELNLKIDRADLNAPEEVEIQVTQKYLPEAISEAELTRIVQDAVASTGAVGAKEMGKVIGAVMAQVKGRAEGSTVSRLVKAALGKKRIFELYLNSIEWGDGVFGIDAAAKHWFGTSAAGLSARQSVRLACVIINPRRYSPVAPDRRIERRTRMIASRLHRRGALSDADYRAVLGLPDPAPTATDSLSLAPALSPADSAPAALPPTLAPDSAAREGR